MKNRNLFAVATLLVSLAAEVRGETRGSTSNIGLDRIDQRSSFRNNRYSVSRYGRGVTVWIFDDECFTGHPEFAGSAGSRASNAFAASGMQFPQGTHGTAMASIVAGRTVGVANLATIKCVDIYGPVPPIGNFGWTLSSLTEGVDYVLSHRANTGMEVVNFSLEIAANTQVDAQIQRLLDAGITVVASAGNAPSGSGDDVSNHSPARVPGVITVANLDTSINGQDIFYAQSNRGAGVDILAPGVNINAAGSGVSYAVNSGTSEAAAAVTGVVALFLESNAGASPQTVSAALQAAATSGFISALPPNTTNKVLFSSFLPPMELSELTTYTPSVSQKIGATSSYSGNLEDGVKAIARRDLSDGSTTMVLGGYHQGGAVTTSCFLHPTKTYPVQSAHITHYTAGTLLWTRTIAPIDAYCGASVGYAEVTALKIDAGPEKDVWVAIKYTPVVIQNALSETHLKKLSAVDGHEIFSTLVGADVDVAAITDPGIVSNKFYVVGTMGAANANFNAPIGGLDGFYLRVDRISYAVSDRLRFGSTSSDKVLTAHLLTDSAIVVGGATLGVVAGSTNAGGYDAFVLKTGVGVSPLGYQQGTTADEAVTTLAYASYLPNAVFLVGGYTFGALDSPLAGQTLGGQDGFFWRIDSSNFGKTFGAQIGSTGSDAVTSVRAIDLNNQEYFLFSATTTGSWAGANPVGGRDCVIGQFAMEPSSLPELRWLWQSASAGDEEARSLEFVSGSTTNSSTNPGTISVVGWSSGTFPPQTAPLGAGDGFKVGVSGI